MLDYIHAGSYERCIQGRSHPLESCRGARPGELVGYPGSREAPLSSSQVPTEVPSTLPTTSPRRPTAVRGSVALHAGSGTEGIPI
jgi:hypothetical protein